MDAVNPIVLSRQKYIGISSQLSVANNITQPGAGFCLPGMSINIILRVAAYRKKGRYTIAIIQPAEAKTSIIYRRIGSTTYKVRVHFSGTAQETINDKILRLIQREAVTNGADCGTMDIPQTSQPLEGSSA